MEKETEITEQPSPQGAPESGEPRGDGRSFGIGLRFSPRHLTAAGLTAALFVLGLWCFWDLRLQTNDLGETAPAVWFLALYGALGLGSVLLCLLELRLPGLLRRVMGWLAVLLMPAVAFFEVDTINNTRIASFSFQRLLANYLCYLMVFALLYAVSRRAWIAVLAGGGAFLAFGIINCFVTQFRGQPILPLDLQSIATAAEVSSGYQYRFDRPMVLSMALLVFATLLACKLGPKGKGDATWRSRTVERLCALAVFGVLAFLIFPMDLLTGMGISVWPWNQKTSSEITGVMAGFFGNVQFMMVDKPDGYSPEAVEELGEELSLLPEPAPLGDPGKAPTVVVVMNESMTDFQNTGNIELTQDNQPFLHSLQGAENVIWGTAYSSVYGGNTCNSEYEFLTGNSTAFFPAGSIPYQQYVTHEQTALPAILKAYGYSCTAIHPGNRAAWQRNKAYPYLGFDEFIAAKNFTVERRLVHGLTSDESCYDQVIYEYEHRDKSTPQFLFNVTIQNHGGFEDQDVKTTVQVKGREGEWPQAEQYLSLTKLSDQALERLIGYFEQQEDPVVVLFFGDHWPNLETGFVSELFGTDASDLSFSDLMRKHEVPFLLWANYPLEDGHIERISLNYLSGLLLRATGLEGTDYTRFLESLRLQAPVVTGVGVIDSEGNASPVEKGSDWEGRLNDYAILQYNNAFGGEEKVESLFTVPAA